jgi:Retrotransposon gag protein/Zinc knuckle
MATARTPTPATAAGAATGGAARATAVAAPPAYQPPPQPPIVIQQPTHVRVKEPELFKGQPGQLEPFIAQLRLYFGFNTERLTTDQDKVVFATSYFRDKAYDWVAARLKDYLRNPGDAGHELREDETNEIFENFNNFERRLTEVFGKVDKARTAVRQIMKLRQTTSAAAYAAEFQGVASKLDWEDDALGALFYRGLKEGVKDELARMERSDELSQLITQAIRIDTRLYERQQERKGQYFPTMSKRQPKEPRGGARNYYGPQPMEIDNLQRPGKGSPKKNKNVQLCYACGRPGHYAKECKQKEPRKPSSRTCYNCGKKGHMARECKGKKLNNLERGKKEMRPKDHGEGFTINMMEHEAKNEEEY